MIHKFTHSVCKAHADSYADRDLEEAHLEDSCVYFGLYYGYSKQISNEKAREMGIRAFVMKPLTQHELANAVRNVLDDA